MAACRAGLERHPSYLSARVTLGRALQELGQISDARREFEYVLSMAPDNLAAIRGLGELSPDPVPVQVPVRSSETPAELSTGTGTGPGSGSGSPVRLEPLKRAPRPAEPLAVQAASNDPDLRALDVSLEGTAGSSASDAERAAQIERLEIWLAKLEQAREAFLDE